MDNINLGSYPQPWLCPLCLMTNYGCSGDLVIAVEQLWTLLQVFTTSHPHSYTGPKLVRTSKKQSEIA